MQCVKYWFFVIYLILSRVKMKLLLAVVLIFVFSSHCYCKSVSVRDKLLLKRVLAGHVKKVGNVHDLLVEKREDSQIYTRSNEEIDFAQVLMDNFMRFLAPYQHLMNTKILDLPEETGLSFLGGIMHVVALVHPHCQELILTSYLAGAIEIELEQDSNLERDLAYLGLHRRFNLTMTEEELRMNLTEIRERAFRPAVNIIHDLSSDYGIRSAKTFFEDLFALYTVENLSKWTLGDATKNIIQLTISWHGNHIAPFCTPAAGTTSVGIFSSFRYIVEEALEKLDRCRIKDVFVSELHDIGIDLPENYNWAFNYIIGDYVERKRHILFDIVFSDPYTDHFFYLLYQFFDRHLHAPVVKAYYIKDWQFLADYVDQSAMDQIISYVSRPHVYNLDLIEPLFVGLIEGLLQQGVDDALIQSLVEETLNNVIERINSQEYQRLKFI